MEENLVNIINRANDESWHEYCEDHYHGDHNIRDSFDHGYKEGIEWMLTELMITLQDSPSLKLLKENLNKLSENVLEYVNK